MTKSFRIFLAIQGVLGLCALYSIIHSRGLAILGLVAFVVFFLGMKRRNVKKNQGIAFLFVGIILALLLFSNIFVWLMLAVAIVYFSVFTQGGIGLHYQFEDGPADTDIIFVQSKEPEGKRSQQRYKGQWFGSKSYGNDTYEWDDINIINLVGDTIIDLGNTLLPKEDAVILIRKGAGRTRVLVPTGIGISFEHSSLAGVAKFEGEEYKLNNETLKAYSKEFDESSRKIRIISSTLLGEIEVIRV